VRVTPEPLFGAAGGWQAEPVLNGTSWVRTERRPEFLLKCVHFAKAAVSLKTARRIVIRMGGDFDRGLRAHLRAGFGLRLLVNDRRSKIWQ